MFAKIALIQTLAATALAGTVIWDGRFNEMTDSTYLNGWSWSTQIAPYQYYIHGSGAVTKYVNLSPSYKNPADTFSNQGAKISIDNTAYWNGQNMRRTELIPQTTAPINKGHVYYHFSVKRTNTNAPRADLEHQVNFFESHFVELKYGLLSGASGSSDPTLKFCVGGSCKWNTPFEADVWHNVAYDINFDTNQVAFYHSTGSDALTLKSGPFSVSTSSNGADWHLGVLRLPMNSQLNSADVEDWYFSGVYVESGSLNTSVGSGSAPAPVTTTTSSRPPVVTTTRSTTTTTSVRPTTTMIRTTVTTSIRTTTSVRATTTPYVPTTTPMTTTTAAPTTTAASSGPKANQWQQCGGNGFSGPTECASPFTCTKLNDWYHQCL